MKLKINLLGFLIIFLLVFSACELFEEDDVDDDFVPTEFELNVFDLTNIERSKHSLPPLIWHNTLAFAAREHSADLMHNNMTGHTGSDGSTVKDRIERAGITNWKSLAENCAYGQTTPEAVVTAWMNSEGHRNNILSSNVTHLGVGLVNRPQGFSAQYATYWTQKFCAFW